MLATTSWTRWLQNLQTRIARKRASRSTRRPLPCLVPADRSVEALETRVLLTTTFFNGPVPSSALEGGHTPMVFTVSIDVASINTTRFLIALTGTATSPDMTTGLAGPGTDYAVIDASGLPMLPILDVIGLVPPVIPVGSYPIKPVINPGELSTTFTLTPINDSLVEADETVIATVINVTFNGGGGKLDLPLVTTGTATITDDDTALVSISGAPTVVEGGALAFPVTMSAPSSTDTTISYSFGGTATGGSDFTNTTASVTIPAGATLATITVPTIDDNLVEPNETVSVTLGTIIGNPGITLGATTAATGTINDNDTATVTISGAPTATEGGNLVFTVTQSAPSTTDTVVNYRDRKSTR